MLVIRDFRPKNIMISDIWQKNYRIAELHILLVSKFDGKKLFHHINAPRRILILTDY